MTNSQIITDAAINAGIFTEEQAAAILSTGRRLPLHTFAEWKNLGYMVKKGEKARLAVEIWRKSNKTQTTETKDGEEIEIDTSRFYKKLSHFFTFDQVQKMAS